MHIELLIIQQENNERDLIKSELASQIYKKQDFVPILLTSQQGLTHSEEALKTGFLKQKLLEKRVMEYDILEDNLSVDTYSQAVLANRFFEEINPENIGVFGSELFVNIANKIYPEYRNFIHIPSGGEKYSLKDKIKEKVLFYTLDNYWKIKNNDVKRHEKALRTFHPVMGFRPRRGVYSLFKNS